MLRQHPDRGGIQAEAHARPPMPIQRPGAEVWHWVLFDAPEDRAAWPGQIDPEMRHQVLELEDGSLRFERHSEFVALTFFGGTPPGTATLEFINACPGVQLAGAKVLVRVEPGDCIEELFGTARLFGGVAMYDGVEVRTDFQVDADGLIRYLVTGEFEDPFARGRLVKRLLDLETYRMASLLALPLVRRLQGGLTQLEEKASAATRLLSDGTDGLDRAISELANILRECAALKDAVRYRIAAASAYDDLVKNRLDGLAERPVGHQQTLRGFIEHRLSPGMLSVISFQRRTDDLVAEVTAALSLARTQLDHVAQQQSRDLLASMAASARQQVHLAQAVESFSVAAITYYAVGLVSYALKGLPDIAISDTTIIAASIVPVALGVFGLTRLMRKRILRLGRENDES